MICENCKNEISENIMFCGFCGHEVSVQSTEATSNHPEDITKVYKRKRKGILLFILSFFLFAGIISGMCGAYYVAKHGWEVVPFAEKLEFLPYVKLNEEKMEFYTVPTDELTETREDKMTDKE